MIHRHLRRSPTLAASGVRILNAGSGPWLYGLGEVGSVQVDIEPSTLPSVKPAVVADLAALPFREQVFGAIVCVGSVLNYDEPDLLIAELARVLRGDGTLFLEYERVIPKLRWRGACPPREVTPVAYRGVPHRITMLSDSYVDRLLQASGLRVARRAYFHVLSTVLGHVLPRWVAARLAAWCDWVPGIQGLRRFAANAFLVIRPR